MPSSVSIRVADERDAPACKRIAHTHRAAIGFLPGAAFLQAAGRRQLLVADAGPAGILGFVRFNHRTRGPETALYDICVEQDCQGQGIGRALVAALRSECRAAGRSSIALRCPEGLPANAFYARVGFRQCGVESGRRRRLLVWRLFLEATGCSS